MSQSGDLTVGEVLSLLQEDYPEATLGRLREFEDLTLIAPELGPSGHRRYPAETLDRLRWVLAKMREGFDPADLVGEDGEPGDASASQGAGTDPRPSGSAAVVRKKSVAEPTLFDTSDPNESDGVDDQTAVQPLPSLAGGRAHTDDPVQATPPEDGSPAPRTPSATTSKRRASSVGEPTAAHRVVEPPAETAQRPPRRQPEPPSNTSRAPEPAAPTKAPAKAPSEPPKPRPIPATSPSAPEATSSKKPERPSSPSNTPAPTGSGKTDRDLHAERKARIEAVSTLQEPPPSEPPARPRPSRTRDLPSATTATELLTRTDFLGEVDIDETTLGEMERFGVISPVTIGGTSSYDQSAVRVGHIVANLLKLGYEARHLRMFRMASEREVDLLRQMALPLLKQRNPVGREQARERLQQAADLGGQLHAALVAEGVAELVDQSGADSANG